MTRIERIGDATLYLGDCRLIMAQWPNKNYAAVISDPPYEQRSQNAIGGITRNDGGKVTERLSFAGIDDIRTDVAEACTRICNGWVLLFCTAEGVAPWRDAIEQAGAKYKRAMVWIKPDAMPQFNGQGPAMGFENIVAAWSGDGRSAWNGGGKRGVFTHPTNSPNRHGVHPTEKPTSLMSELVELFSSPGDVVVDPFMGSGTTGVACAKLGRSFVGMEIDERYFDIACRRIEQATRQGDIFRDAPPKPVQEALL